MKTKLIILILLIFVQLLIAAEYIYMPLVTFNTGRVTPHLEARTDYEKYRAACRQLSNMVVTAQGPVTKRPGTQYIATSAETQDVSRLIPFQFSTDDTYILEFIDDKMYVYRNGAQVEQ